MVMSGALIILDIYSIIFIQLNLLELSLTFKMNIENSEEEKHALEAALEEKEDIKEKQQSEHF